MAIPKTPVMYATQLTEGQRIKGVGKFASIGEAIVLYARQSLRGNMKVKVEVAIQTGKRAGENTTLTYPASCNILNTLEIMGKTSGAKLKKEREALQEKHTERYYKGEETLAKVELLIEPGDIVRINGGEDSWEMKVLEVDRKEMKLKGINAYITNPASRFAYARMDAPDVAIELVKKGAFDPKTDRATLNFYANKERTANRRSTTRADRATLRSIYGF